MCLFYWTLISTCEPLYAKIERVLERRITAFYYRGGTLDKKIVDDTQEYCSDFLKRNGRWTVLEEPLLFIELFRRNEHSTFLHCAESPKLIYARTRFDNLYLTLLTKSDFRKRINTILDTRKIGTFKSSEAIQKFDRDILGFMNFESFFNKKIPDQVLAHFSAFLLKNKVEQKFVGEQHLRTLVLSEGDTYSPKEIVTIFDNSDKSFSTAIGKIILAAEHESDNLTR